MSKIQAIVVADSINSQKDRLTSVLVTMPRIILSEMNTHRMLSKNTSSSRAIPFKKMVESVQNDPFVPIAWQKEHKGMQGSEYITDEGQIRLCNNNWLNARDNAVSNAHLLSIKGATKQLCNRLLEPFMWTTMLITGSKEGWDNFFELRCPQYEWRGKLYKSVKDLREFVGEDYWIGMNYNYSMTEQWWRERNKGQAEIHIMDLAEKIYDAMNESAPKELKAGEWHIPFWNKMNELEELKKIEKLSHFNLHDIKGNIERLIKNKVKISTAMAARTSYTVVGDEKEIDYSKMIELHDRLIAQNPPHSSPMEHCARAMDNKEYNSFIKGEARKEDGQYRSMCGLPVMDNFSKGWCRNFKGFIPYRHIIETQ